MPHSAPDWNRFSSLRDHLFEQYRSIPWDDSTGLAGDDLRAAVEEALARTSDRSRIVQKAAATATVLRHGRIAIDPEDWFVDKLDNLSNRERDGDNGGGIIGDISRGWLDEATDGVIQETSAWLDTARETGYASVPTGGLDRGHVSLGWDVMLSEGLSGLLRRVRGFSRSRTHSRMYRRTAPGPSTRRCSSFGSCTSSWRWRASASVRWDSSTARSTPSIGRT